MHDFRTAVRRLDSQALQYHLDRGNFSRWLEDTIADKHLAARVVGWEGDPAAAGGCTEDDAMDNLHRHLFAILLDNQWTHGVSAAVDVALLRPVR